MNDHSFTLKKIIIASIASLALLLTALPYINVWAQEAEEGLVNNQTLSTEAECADEIEDITILENAKAIKDNKESQCFRVSDDADTSDNVEESEETSGSYTIPPEDEGADDSSTEKIAEEITGTSIYLANAEGTEEKPDAATSEETVSEDTNNIIVASGTCGDDLTWQLKGENTEGDLNLTITGEGAMTDYGYMNDTPWNNYREQIAEIDLDDRITSIGDYSFCNFTNIYGAFIFPSSLIRIGNEAFEGCTHLSGNLVIPDNVTEIGIHAFSGCTGYNGALKLSDSLEAIGYGAFEGCNFTGELVLPDSLTEIGFAAFEGCRKFTGSLTIPSKITKIEGYTFQDTGFTGDIIIPENVKEIGEQAFYNAGFDGKLVLPNGLKSIGDSAFLDCYGLSGQLIIPASVTSIGMQAFCNDRNFTGELVIREKTKSIGTRAFKGCSGLKSIILSEGLKTIESSAFEKCDGINEITIPSSVLNIGANAFSACNNLKQITFAGNAPSISPESTNSSGEQGSFDASVILYYSTGSAGFETPKWNGYSCYETGTATANGVSIEADSFVITSSTNVQLNAVVTPSDAADKSVTWSVVSSSGATFAVDQNGIVTVSNITGTYPYASIWCTTTDGGYVSQCEVYYHDGDLGNIKVLKLYPSSKTVYVGDTVHFSWNVTPENDGGWYDGAILWKTGDPEIVGLSFSKNNTGPTITALKPGKATITVTAEFGGASATCELTVLSSSDALSLDADKVSLSLGGTKQINAYYADGLQASDITWTSTNAKIASVDANGLVTAASAGTATITASAGSGTATASCTVTVSDELTGEKLLGYYASIRGDINFNFVLSIPSALQTDPGTAYVKFTFPDGSVQQQLVKDAEKVAVNNTVGQKFTCAVPAKNMSDTITVQLYDSHGNHGTAYKMSVKDYCNSIIDNADQYSSEIVDFTKAMLDYGAAAQLYFGYNTDNLASSDLSALDQITADEVKLYSDSEVNNETKKALTYLGTSLTLDTTTTMRIHFKTANGTALTASDLRKDSDLTIVSTEDDSYIEISNIYPRDLDDVQRICLKTPSGNCSISVSPLNYCYKVLNSSDANANLQQLMKALFHYYKTAEKCDAYVLME